MLDVEHNTLGDFSRSILDVRRGVRFLCRACGAVRVVSTCRCAFMNTCSDRPGTFRSAQQARYYPIYRRSAAG